MNDANHMAKSLSRTAAAFRRPRGRAGSWGDVALAVLGIAAGLAIYILVLLGQPLRTRIGMVDPASMDPVSLDGITLADETGPVVPLGQGGRPRVYVHPDIPIRKVTQKDPGIETILIFCVDSSGPADIACRSGSLILLTIDRPSKEIRLTSISRDIQVPIEGRTEKDRINAVYAYGGAGLLINTLNGAFGLDIQRFAMFDFNSAGDLVDMTGGIKLEITKEEIPYLNQCLAEQNALAGETAPTSPITRAGIQKVNGRQAAAWARIRRLDSDSARTGRQSTVLRTLIRSFAESGPGSLISLMNDGLGAFETNMTVADRARMAADALPCIGAIREYHIPSGEGMYEADANPWMLILDWGKQLPALHAFIWGTP
jgi:polyisoprenyl-teichoic acid--peptidoglycan teichoic acid transferase